MTKSTATKKSSAPAKKAAAKHPARKRAAPKPHAPAPTSKKLIAAQREFAERILSKRKLMPFIKRMNPRYLNGWVHDDIAERLEKFSQDVADGKSPRLMILMPPRHGKSELASRMFPAWHLGKHPDHEFIACSYSLPLAMTFSRRVQQTLEDPAYKVIFGSELDPNNKSVEAWGLLNEPGGYLAAGVGGGITGRGAHILLIDDPIKNAEEADSFDHREKVWDWYLSVAYTRLAPGGGVLIIQTWWHDDDLAGKVQALMAEARKMAEENEEEVDEDVDYFDVVKYPAIAENDEWLDEDTREIVQECPEHNRGRLLRRRGEALHAARYDLKKLNRIRRQNRRMDGSDGRWWSALYQQNPVPLDGSYFTKDMFLMGPGSQLQRCYVFQAWDFAISEKRNNDWTVGMTCYLDEFDVAHVMEVRRFKSQDTYRIVNEMLDMAKRHDSPSIVMGVEDGQIWKALSAVFKKRMEERVAKGLSPRYVSVEPLQPLTDKTVRARALQARMQAGKLAWTNGGWYEQARGELLRFPAGVHDDVVDAGAWVAHVMVGKQCPQPARRKARKSWQDDIAKAGTDNEVSAMAA
jgi:phage terminase large subunit-like protein